VYELAFSPLKTFLKTSLEKSLVNNLFFSFQLFHPLQEVDNFIFIYLINFASPSFSPLQQFFEHFFFFFFGFQFFFSFLGIDELGVFFFLCLAALSPLKWMDNFSFSLSTSFLFWNRQTIYCCCETKKVIWQIWRINHYLQMRLWRNLFTLFPKG
jgi:hypothetical protein